MVVRTTAVKWLNMPRIIIALQFLVLICPVGARTCADKPIALDGTLADCARAGDALSPSGLTSACDTHFCPSCEFAGTCDRSCRLCTTGDTTELTAGTNERVTEGSASELFLGVPSWWPCGPGSILDCGGACRSVEDCILSSAGYESCLYWIGDGACDDGCSQGAVNNNVLDDRCGRVSDAGVIMTFNCPLYSCDGRDCEVCGENPPAIPRNVHLAPRLVLDILGLAQGSNGTSSYLWPGPDSTSNDATADVRASYYPQCRDAALWIDGLRVSCAELVATGRASCAEDFCDGCGVAAGACDATCGLCSPFRDPADVPWPDHIHVRGAAPPHVETDDEGKDGGYVASEVAQRLVNPSGRHLWSFDDSYRLYQRLVGPGGATDGEAGDPARAALTVLGDALRLFGPDRVVGSFNGGKDAVVILHLLRAAVAAHSVERGVLHQPRFVYFRHPRNFPALEAFAARTARASDLDLEVLDGDMGHSLARLVERAEGCTLGIVMGTRRGDPDGGAQQAFTPSSAWMPPFMRVNPLLDWSYGEVWGFLMGHQLPYCSLYDEGYTSLGHVDDTVKNPALRIDDGANILGGQEARFLPAHALADYSLERAGRVDKPSRRHVPFFPPSSPRLPVVAPVSWVIVLTTAVAPLQGITHTKRLTPRLRVRDYAASLRRWAGGSLPPPLPRFSNDATTQVEHSSLSDAATTLLLQSTLWPVVVVESSGANLTDLRRAVAEGQRSAALAGSQQKGPVKMREIEFVSLRLTRGQVGDLTRGKGVAEAASVAAALAGSALVRRLQPTHACKVTGRYFVPGLDSELSRIAAEVAAQVADEVAVFASKNDATPQSLSPGDGGLFVVHQSTPSPWTLFDGVIRSEVLGFAINAAPPPQLASRSNEPLTSNGAPAVHFAHPSGKPLGSGLGLDLGWLFGGQDESAGRPMERVLFEVVRALNTSHKGGSVGLPVRAFGPLIVDPARNAENDRVLLL